MNYSDPKLQSLLAAEYVLGSLQGAARHRFETLLLQEPGLRNAVEYWQYRLHPLAENVKPIQPPKKVWRTIRARIRSRRAVGEPWWNILWSSLDFWRGFSLASVLIIVGGYLVSPGFQESKEESLVQYVAVLQDDRARPMMVASMARDGRSLLVDMLGEDSTGDDKVMQVWCVPKDGGMPMSLGLLTSKQGVFELSLEQLKGLHKASEIVISFELMEVAPAEIPQGQVMYRGVMI